MRSLVILAFISIVGAASAQVVIGDRPKPYVPKKPPTRQEQDRRASLHKYVEGLMLERQAQFTDALKAFEDAAWLDPNEPAVVRAQIPLLVNMNRFGDALIACKKVVALDPGDFATWFVQAKLFKNSARYNEAIKALESALKSATLKDHPEGAQAIYFELGGLYEGDEKHELSADAYSKAAEILEHPDLILAKGNFSRELILARAADTHEKIGQLYHKAKKYDAALAALKKAQKHGPDRVDRLNFVMARICQEHGAHQQALDHVNAYLTTRPLSAEPYEMKIDLLRRLKRAEQIVPWLETAAEREAHNRALQVLLAKEYAAARNTTKAESLFKKLSEDAPEAEVFRGLFHLQMEEGPKGVTRVLDTLDKTIDEAKQNERPGFPPDATQRRAVMMVDAVRDDAELAKKLIEAGFPRTDLKYHTSYLLGILADRHRKNDEAERFFRQCLKNPAQANEANIYNGLLRALGRSKKHEAVIATCEAGLKDAKATSPLLFYSELARAQAALKRHDQALKTADVALAQAGDNSKLAFKMLRVRILTIAERYDDAQRECLASIQASEKASETLELRYLLANVYSAAKQQAKSEEQLQIILKADPDNATVNNDLGYLWADQGRNLETAEEMIRRALDVDRLNRKRKGDLSSDDKDNAAYVDSLGWVLFRRGKIEEARKELERAVKLDEEGDPVIFDHLGDVYLRLRMRPEASRAWQRALELYRQGVRKDDERVRDLQRKINQVKEEIGGR